MTELSSTKRSQGEDRDFGGYPASVRALMQLAERGHRACLDDGTREAYTIASDGRRSSQVDYALACEHWNAIEKVATVPATRKRTRLKPKLHLKPPAEKAPPRTETAPANARKGEWLGTSDAIDRIGISHSMFKRRKAEWIEAGLLEEKTAGGRGRGKFYRFDGELCELARALVEKHPATQANARHATDATDATPATVTSARHERPQPAEVSPEVAAIADAIEREAKAEPEPEPKPEPESVPDKNIIAPAQEAPEPSPEEVAEPVVWAKSLAVTLSARATGMTFDLSTITMPSTTLLTLYVDGDEGIDLNVEQATALSLLLGGALRQAESMERELRGGVA